jgi:dephospho-CoA kinase
MHDADINYRQTAQDSDEELRQRADVVLDNSGTLDDLATATQTLLAILRTLPPRPVEIARATDE